MTKLNGTVKIRKSGKIKGERMRKEPSEKKFEKRKFVYNRVYTCVLFAFIQLLVWIALLYFVEHEATPVVRVIIWIIAGGFVLYLVNRTDTDSSAKMKWIIMILVFPVLGIAFFLMYGEGRPTVLMSKRYNGSKLINKPYLVQSKNTERLVEESGRDGAVCQYLFNEAGYPAYADGSVEYYPTGAELFEEMMKELEKAEKFVLVEYFIIGNGKLWDRLRAKLLEKAQAGVKIYIIFDDFGSVLVLPRHYERYLESLHENIKAIAFNRVMPLWAIHQNSRDHRKMFVIDDKIAFTGGLNLADEYIGEKIRFGDWKDSGVKIQGGAVHSFIVMFFNLWNAFRKGEKTDLTELLSTPEDNARLLVEKEENSFKEQGARSGFFVQPFDDSPLDRKSDGEFVYLDLIKKASKYIYIFTPYLILPDGLRTALCHASMRGVDVRIVTPAIPDKKTVFRMTRANYPVLMDHGVKIYEYTPGFLHSKSIVVDDEYAVVGSINFDYRSLYLHFENAVYFSGCDAVKAVRKDCEKTFEVSLLQTEETTKRSWFGRLVDSVLRFFDTVV